MTLTCADCGCMQIVPALPRAGIAQCHRCDRLLDRTAVTHCGVSLVAASAALLLYPAAALLPLMHSTIQNLVFEESRLVSSVPAIYRDVWWPFALGFFAFALAVPAFRAFCLVLTLGSLRLGRRLPGAGRLFRWHQELTLFAMSDVVVVAGIVTYYRASVPAVVEVLPGAWCYVAVALLSAVADRSLDVRGVWDAIHPDAATPPPGPRAACSVCELTCHAGDAGRKCPRCGARLAPDLRRFLPAVVALAAAVPLAIPTYAYAVMVNDRLTGLWEHTLFGTVRLVAEGGFWPLALVLLVAGAVVPVLELAGFAWLLARVRFPSRAGLVARTRLYRVLRDLVRWPMVIPFIAATSTPIVDFPGIDDIIAGPAATPFFLMVVLTMLVVRLFEPRLMWRAAGAGGSR